MVQHADLGATEHAHSVLRWPPWANEAARLAQSVSASDLHKVGYQTDTGVHYVLTGHGPAVWQGLASSVGLAEKVTGPAGATATALCRFDGTTGKLCKNSTATLSDSGAMTLPIASIAAGFDAAITLENSTASTDPAPQQAAPAVRWIGTWWDGSASRTATWIAQARRRTSDAEPLFLLRCDPGDGSGARNPLAIEHLAASTVMRVGTQAPIAGLYVGDAASTISGLQCGEAFSITAWTDVQLLCMLDTAPLRLLAHESQYVELEVGAMGGIGVAAFADSPTVPSIYVGLGYEVEHGMVRLPTGGGMWARNVAGDGDVRMIHAGSAGGLDGLFVGSHTDLLAPQILRLRAHNATSQGSISIDTPGTTNAAIEATGTAAKFGHNGVAHAESDSAGLAIKTARLDTIEASRPLALTDAGRVMLIGGELEVVVTVPWNEDVAFPIGTQIVLVGNTTDEMTIVADDDEGDPPEDFVVLEHPDELDDVVAAEIPTNGAITLLKIGTDRWRVIGPLANITPTPPPPA